MPPRPPLPPDVVEGVARALARVLVRAIHEEAEAHVRPGQDGTCWDVLGSTKGRRDMAIVSDPKPDPEIDTPKPAPEPQRPTQLELPFDNAGPTQLELPLEDDTTPPGNEHDE